MWLQGHTHILYTEIDYPVPCRTRRPTGTQHQASAWHNKLRAIIIPRADLQKHFRPPWDPSLPSSEFHTVRALSMTMNGENQLCQIEEIYRSKNQVFGHIKQGSDGIWNKFGRPKVTDIGCVPAPDENLISVFTC